MFHYRGEADFNYFKLNHIFYYPEHNIQRENWIFPLRQLSRYICSLPLNGRHTQRQQEDYVLPMTTTRTVEKQAQTWTDIQCFNKLAESAMGLVRMAEQTVLGATLFPSNRAHTHDACFLHPLSQLLFIQRPGKAETNIHKHACMNTRTCTHSQLPTCILSCTCDWLWFACWPSVIRQGQRQRANHLAPPPSWPPRAASTQQNSGKPGTTLQPKPSV